MRNSNPPSMNRSTPSNFGGAGGMNNVPPTPIGFNMNSSGGGYRGNRGGGYNNRSGGMNGMSNYNRGGFQQQMTGGFQGNAMNGFQGPPMGAMPSYGGFQNRGGMMGGMRGGQMGMRGGRGAMNPNGMMGMPMNGMGMGGMGAQMNGIGMSMSQMGAMGMQGMQASLSYSYTNTAGNLGFLTTITKRPNPPLHLSMSQDSPTSQAGQYEITQTRSFPFTKEGGSRCDIQNSQGPSLLPLARYALPKTATAPPHFPSQFIASAPPVAPSPSNQSGILSYGAFVQVKADFKGPRHITTPLSSRSNRRDSRW